METKKCFKCGRELPITEFYRHPRMADGHLNKCKECTKNDVHKNYEKNIQSEEYIEKQRARGRDKYRRLGYVSKKNPHSENRNTRRFLSRRGIDVTGLEVHHWNYNRKKDVFLLGRREHKYIHNFLVYDPISKMFYYNGELLESKQQHRAIIVELLKKAAEEIQEYDFE